MATSATSATSAKRKRTSLAREVRTLRESVAADRHKLHALGLWSDDAAPLRAQVHKDSDRLKELERRLQARREQAATHMRKERAALPPKPARTVFDDLRSRQLAVQTRQDKLAALPPGSDAWCRMSVSLRTAEAALTKAEMYAALCSD